MLRKSNETTIRYDNSGCKKLLVCESQRSNCRSNASKLPLIAGLKEIERWLLTLLFSLLVTDRLPWMFPSFLLLNTGKGTLRNLIVLLLEVLPVFSSLELLGARRDPALTLVLSNFLVFISSLLSAQYQHDERFLMLFCSLYLEIDQKDDLAPSSLNYWSFNRQFARTNFNVPFWLPLESDP